MDIASPLMPAAFSDSLAIGLGNVELAVGVLGEAIFLGHGLDALGVEAVLGVIKVDIVIESADVGVERGDVIGQLHGDPLMGRKCGEQPGLVVVGDDDLVVGAGALLVNQAAEELDALAGRGALAQDDAAVAVLAQTYFLIDGVCGFCLFVIGGAQRGGAGDALLVDAGLGVGIGAALPVGGVVAYIAVAIGGLVRSVFKSRFNRAVRKARFVGRFDAVVLKIALAKVLGAAVVRVAVGC